MERLVAQGALWNAGESSVVVNVESHPHGNRQQRIKNARLARSMFSELPGSCIQRSTVPSRQASLAMRGRRLLLTRRRWACRKPEESRLRPRPWLHSLYCPDRQCTRGFRSRLPRRFEQPPPTRHPIFAAGRSGNAGVGTTDDVEHATSVVRNFCRFNQGKATPFRHHLLRLPLPLPSVRRLLRPSAP